MKQENVWTYDLEDGLTEDNFWSLAGSVAVVPCSCYCNNSPYSNFVIMPMQ